MIWLLKLYGRVLKIAIASSPKAEVGAETWGSTEPVYPGSSKIVPLASIVLPLKKAVGTRGVIAIDTSPLIQFRDIEALFIHVS